jgi:hypothetical protein
MRSCKANSKIVWRGRLRPIVILSEAKNLRAWARSFAPLRMTGWVFRQIGCGCHG